MPKRRPPAPRAPKVPARFRALGGVDPRKLPPGTPYPCGDALVGQRARGKRLAGVVQSCAVPPAGSRGPHYALGNVVSGSEIGRAWRSSAREAEAIDARYSGPDFDLRRKRAPKARTAAPSPAPAAPRPAVTRREELPLPLPQGGLRRREVSPEGLEIVRGFDELSRRWGLLPSSASTQKWLAGLMVIDGDLHVYGDALVAIGVAGALGNLYPPSTIRDVFKSAFNDAARAASLAGMGQDDRTPVVVDVKPVPPMRAQPVTRNVRLSFTAHASPVEHFDVRAAQGARLTRATELAAPLPQGGLPRPKAKQRVPEMAGPAFDPREVLRVDADAPVRRLVRVEITTPDTSTIAPRDIEVNGQRIGVGWDVQWGSGNAPDVVTVGPAWSERGFGEPGMAVADVSVKAIERLNRGASVRVVDVTSEYAIIATTAPPRYDSGGTVRIPAPGYEPSKFRGLVGGPKWRVVAIPKGWLQWQIDRNRSGSHPTAVVTLGEVNASMVKRREEMPLPLPEGGLSRPAPRPALRAPDGYSPEAVRAVVGSFFATGPIAPQAVDVLEAAVFALYSRVGTTYTLRDPRGQVPSEIELARDASVTKRRAVRIGAITRTARAAKSLDQKLAAQNASTATESVSRLLRILTSAAPLGVFPVDSASAQAAPSKGAQDLPVPPPDPMAPIMLKGWHSTSYAPRESESFYSVAVWAGDEEVSWLDKQMFTGIQGFNELVRREFDDYEWRMANKSSSPNRQLAWAIAARDVVAKRERIVGYFGRIPENKKRKLSVYFNAGMLDRPGELPLPLPKGGLRRAELPLPLPPGGLPMPRPMPRRSTVARREELPLPVPPGFLKDPPPTEASMPVGEAMEAVAEASAGGTNWSKYQAAIFNFITVGKGNAVVEAVAGSGKSTTIVEAVKRIPSNKSVLVLAFNRTVRDELKEKFEGFTNVTVRTLTGHGWVTMAQAWKPIVQAQGESSMRYQGEARFRQILDAAGVPPPVLYWDRLHRDAARRDADPAHVRLVQWLKKNNYDEGKYEREVMTWNRHYESLKKLIELCRGFMALTPAAIQDVQREYGLLLTMPRRRGDGASAAPRPWTWFDPRTNTTYDTDTVIRWVQAALKASLIRPVDGKVAMFDATFPTAMLDYFAPQQFDWIFVDETQDMDTSQLIVVQKSVAPGGRVVVVGDSKQAIYAFRGADSRAMARMEQALNAVRLPLSVSYRVPKCVETMVRPVVPAFEVPPGTPEGVCKTVTARHMIREWRDGDFVISRKNAPLEPLAIMAIQQGKSVVAVGLADIQKVLRDVVNGAMKFNPTNGDEFRDAIEKYRARQRANIEEIERRKRARSFSRMKDHEVEAFIEDLPVVRTLDLAANAVESMSKRVNGSAEIDQIIASVNYSASRDQIVPASALKGKLAFTSVHKIKGAESPRVWVLNDTFAFQGKVDATGKPNIKNGEEMTDNARQEEINLWYVAVTRAKNTRGGPPGELYLVTGLKDVLGEAYVDDDEDEGKAKDA